MLNEVVGGLLPAGNEVEPDWLKIDDEVFKGCTVAQRYANQIIRDTIHGTKVPGTVDSHQKMKIAQDFIAGIFLHPIMRRRFLQAWHDDPIAGTKLLVSVMPKELNVNIEERKGVILVPMRMENVEEWEKKALAGSAGETIEGQETPRVASWDDLVAEEKKEEE